MKIKEPSYKSSRRFLWLSFCLSWLVIIGAGFAAALGSEQAVAYATIAVPSMVGILVGVLGIHRFTGSMDFNAQMKRLIDEHEDKSS